MIKVGQIWKNYYNNGRLFLVVRVESFDQDIVNIKIVEVHLYDESRKFDKDSIFTKDNIIPFFADYVKNKFELNKPNYSKIWRTINDTRI